MQEKTSAGSQLCITFQKQLKIKSGDLSVKNRAPGQMIMANDLAIQHMKSE